MYTLLGWTLVCVIVIGLFALALPSKRSKRSPRPELEGLGVRIVPATLDWNGPAGGLWSVGANWTGGTGQAPANGDSLVFDNIPGTAANTSSVDDIAGLKLGSLTLNSPYSATLSLNQNLEVDGNVTIQPGTMTINAPNRNALTILNPAPNTPAVFTWGGGVLDSTLSVTLGKLNANATLTLNGLGVSLNGSFDSFANATMTANGDVTMGGSGSFTNDIGSTFNIQSDHGFVTNAVTASITNDGTFEKTAGTGASPIQANFLNSGGTVLAQSGTLAFTSIFQQGSGTTNLAGGSISSQFSFQMQGGYLEGVGTFTLGATHGVNQTGGTLIVGPGSATGGAIGTLTIVGNYTEGANATLVINTDPTGVSRLNVQGNVDVNGTLIVNKDPEFNPPLGNSYAFLTWSSITQADDFSTVTINNNYPYGPRLMLATSRSLPNKEYDLVVVRAL